MEAGVRPDDFRLILQHNAALDLRLFKLIQGSECLIGNTFIRERPQALAGLEFWGVGRQVEQVDALRHHEFAAALPTRLIKDQQHALGRACADRLSEESKRDGEEFCRHAGKQIPLALAGPRLHKRVDVKPLVALLDGHARTRAFTHPDAAQDRFEADAMLIGGPQLHIGLGMSLLQRFQLLRKLFLKASCAAASALAWRGRSTRLLQPNRTRYSQPRWGWT